MERMKCLAVLMGVVLFASFGAEANRGTVTREYFGTWATLVGPGAACDGSPQYGAACTVVDGDETSVTVTGHDQVAPALATIIEFRTPAGDILNSESVCLSGGVPSSSIAVPPGTARVYLWIGFWLRPGPSLRCDPPAGPLATTGTITFQFS